MGPDHKKTGWMVNALLEFSRIESGRSEAVFQPTDLAAYTAEIASERHMKVSWSNPSLAWLQQSAVLPFLNLNF